jgi:hypothetical protein
MRSGAGDGVPRPRCRGHQLRTSLLVQPEDQPQRTLAGQAVGVKQVDHGIWLVSFMDYHLGYLDLGAKNFATPGEPLRGESVTYVSGTFCYPCLRNGQ